MKKLIYAILCISLTAISCGIQTQGAVTVPLLAPKPSKSISNDTNQMRVIDVVEGLNIRVCPGMKCASFGLLQLGDVVTLTQTPAVTVGLSQWVEVEFEGVTGWVNFRYLGVR